MVSYGTWHDSPEFVETHRPRVNGDGPWLMYDETQPYGSSGWGFAGQRNAIRDGESSAPEYLPGSSPPVMNPDFGTAGVSGDAWNNMRDEPQVFDFDPDSVISLAYSGSINPIEDGGPGSHIERWVETDWRAILAYNGGLGTDWATVLGGPVEEWPAGAIGVDIEDASTLHLNDYVHLIDATMQPWTADVEGVWGLTIKDANSSALDPFGPFAPNVGDPFELDMDGMRQVVEDNKTTPGVTYAMPFFTIDWRGGWPGDYGGPDHLRLVTDVILEVIIRYTGPRWRYVFNSVVPVTEQPYRRTFPNDAATEGARRTFPPSRAIQAGRRTSGGYI